MNGATKRFQLIHRRGTPAKFGYVCRRQFLYTAFVYWRPLFEQSSAKLSNNTPVSDSSLCL
jgi:hypothetical protein